MYSTPENNMLQYILLLIHTVPTFTPCIQWGEECSNQAAEMGRTLGTEPWDGEKKKVSRRRRRRSTSTQMFRLFQLVPHGAVGRQGTLPLHGQGFEPLCCPFFCPPSILLPGPRILTPSRPLPLCTLCTLHLCTLGLHMHPYVGPQEAS